MKSAIDKIQKYTGFNPLLWTVGKILDATAPASGAAKQSEAAVEIIKAGKENGVDKMTIVMDEQAGAQFSAPIEGVNISAGVGSKGKIKIEVTYK
jgi:hypothetical protein